MIRILFAAVLLAAACVPAAPENSGEAESAYRDTPPRTSIALSVGMYRPSSSSTRDVFDDSWIRVSLTTFESQRPEEWRFIAEASGYRFNGPTDLALYSVSFGMVRGIGHQRSAQPYVTVRGGPYWGKITDNAAGTSDSNLGLHVNTALGVVIQRNFYVEARYDVFSRFAGVTMDGLSLSAGMRLFDVKW